jgi:hypothetical protein
MNPKPLPICISLCLYVDATRVNLTVGVYSHVCHHQFLQLGQLSSESGGKNVRNVLGQQLLGRIHMGQLIL